MLKEIRPAIVMLILSTLLFGLVQGFDHSAPGENEIRVIVIDDLVNLPQVQMVCAQPFQ